MSNRVDSLVVVIQTMDSRLNSFALSQAQAYDIIWHSAKSGFLIRDRIVNSLHISQLGQVGGLIQKKVWQAKEKLCSQLRLEYKISNIC